MPVLSFQFHRGGLFLPQLALWLDPHEPKIGREKVFVSHAHSDHTGAHREVILSEPTARLMQARIGGQRLEHVLPFFERRTFEGNSREFALTLLPAGHIFGSAMSLLEAAGESLLYTGDFKLRRGLSAEACDVSSVRGVDALIMETTYGRPEYRFPPTEAVIQGVVRFCREALDNDETVVLLGYSLGKSQELLCALGDAKLPIMLHGTVYKLTQIYEKFGRCFPPYDRYDAAQAKGKVLLCPPNVAGSAMIRKLGKVRQAVLTGWAVDPNCRYRYQVDAAFPLSDHADFPDLLELVRQVQPKKVYTLHGFAADFARRLRDDGFEAQALSEDEQMVLPLALTQTKSTRRRPQVAGISFPTHERQGEQATPILLNSADSFHQFALTCDAIAGNGGKLEKVRVLAEYFQQLSESQLQRAAVWFTGLPFASSSNKVLQMGWAVLRDAVCIAIGVSEDELHQVYLKHSDFGETALELFQRDSRNVPTVTMEQVDDFFHQAYLARGPSGKLPLLVDILRRCVPVEAKFLIKIITSDLRIGLKEGLVEEAVASAFASPAEEVREANLLLGNIGETAVLALRRELGRATLVPFRPVKFMLASPEETAQDIWDRLAERHADAVAASSATDVPALSDGPGLTLWVEDKYDGIRCQLHKVGSDVALYSRDLKDISDTFHDLVETTRGLLDDVILDGEILAMRGDKILPFSDLQKRLGRRERDLFMGTEVPIRFVAFDLLWLGGITFLKRPLRERRATLEALLHKQGAARSFALAQITPAHSVAEIEAAFTAARNRDNEGLMVKDPDSVYSPGRRGLSWLKLKKAFATLDCVVVGAEYGHGKRKAVLSDYTFAVRDEVTGELKTIGKAYSGLTDEEIAQLTAHFLSKVVTQHGRYHQVKPDTVLEIAFDRLQPSDRHSSGLAMRFPRIIRIRTDKSPADIDTVASARRLVATSTTSS